MSLFGTDGVRGLVGSEPITPQTVMKLGWAAGCVLCSKGVGNKVLIGKDTRISGYMMESALEAGFSAAGVNVSLLGPMPTPGIAYLTRTARASAGVVISASHNPFHDNGVKIFSSEGTKLDDPLVADIDQKMLESMSCVKSAELGRAERFSDAQGRYIEFCKSTFPSNLDLSGIKLVADCANGAGYEVAPRVFEELGADLLTIANEPDGFNINADCGSTHLNALREAVIESNGQIGVALDGDGDRVLLIDENGDVVDGDRILYLLATYRKQQDTLGGGVAGTLMTNLGLEQALARLEIPFVRTNVGDRFVHEVLVNHDWLLGGENSGHIICLDKNTTGDGIVAALQVLEVMLETQKPLSELVADMTLFPQVMVNVRVEGADAKKLVASKGVVEAAKAAEKELGADGRIVLRPSGTEPLIRVMIEGNDHHQVDRLTNQIADQVKAAM
ncbi:MAG: phosphoglucosamine mutase [Acidiferrobacterales bacterium]|nr:phosphoglucosamine mutase [Acidiferrobacterales bacterium]